MLIRFPFETLPSNIPERPLQR